MNILFDTNIVLDALLDRKPFGPAAASLINMVENSVIGGWLCATTVTTVYYLISKSAGKEKAGEMTELLLKLFEVAPVNRNVLLTALKTGRNDFEDSVLLESAQAVNADGIVTRDPRGFNKVKIAVYTPRELLSIICHQ